MILRKVWTSQYQRYGRAAYAEANDIYIDVIVAEIIAFMADPGSRFYKVEINENGAYVGYFIIKGDKLVSSHVRPHFAFLQADFDALVTGTIGPDGINSSISVYNIKN
jgi:hypothetical protein